MNDRSTDLIVPKFERSLTPDDVMIRNRGLRIIDTSMYRLSGLSVLSIASREPSYRRNSKDINMATTGLAVTMSCSLPADEWVATLDSSKKIGRLRASQGVPSKALRCAFNIGAQTVFNAFMEWAVNEEELSHDHAVLLAKDLWGAFDLHHSVAADALQAAEEEMFGGRRAGELLDALLKGDADRDCVAGVMRAWQWAERARYAVVACHPAGWGAPPVAQAELPAKAAGVQVVWRLQEGYALGVAALGDVPVAAFVAALPSRRGRRTGVSFVVDGLAELGQARRFAELAVLTARDGDGVAYLEKRLPAALLAARQDLAKELSARVFAPVFALDQVSRQRLLGTLAAWVEAGGSIRRAADALFCHPRTVFDRLRRLERLTRRSLAVPKDLVELTLAIEAVQMDAARSQTAGRLL